MDTNKLNIALKPNHGSLKNPNAEQSNKINDPSIIQNKIDKSKLNNTIKNSSVHSNLTE